MMKSTVIIILLLAGGAGAWFCKIPYNSNSPETMSVAQAFATLHAAWDKDDTNTVINLCIQSFDPYSTNNFPQMAFNMMHQSNIKRTALHPVMGEPSTYRFQPNAYRNWYSFITAPQYLLGQVYFYTKEFGEWRFTGETDYHVD